MGFDQYHEPPEEFFGIDLGFLLRREKYPFQAGGSD